MVRGNNYQYHLAGRRTRMTWPDNFWVSCDYLTTGDMTHIREYGATSTPNNLLPTSVISQLGNDFFPGSMTQGRGPSMVFPHPSRSILSRLAGVSPGTPSRGHNA